MIRRGAISEMKALIVVTLCLVLVLAGCSTRQRAATIGGAVGAGTGAIIGYQSGHEWEGAAIGAAGGAAAGYLIDKYFLNED